MNVPEVHQHCPVCRRIAEKDIIRDLENKTTITVFFCQKGHAWAVVGCFCGCKEFFPVGKVFYQHLETA